MPTHYRGAQREVQALDAYIKLLRAADAVRARAGSHLAAEQLTGSQFGVLEALLHLGPLCQRAIAGKLLVSGGNITLVIDNLEKRGLVQRRREQDDRRYITVSLTAAGRRLIERVFRRHVARVVEEMETLSRPEQRQLGALCRRIGKKEKKL
jgi:MarR family 2-MHQ and catechol resistance regulon transcriptional repressor